MKLENNLPNIWIPSANSFYEVEKVPMFCALFAGAPYLFVIVWKEKENPQAQTDTNIPPLHRRNRR